MPHLKRVVIFINETTNSIYIFSKKAPKSFKKQKNHDKWTFKETFFCINSKSKTFRLSRTPLLHWFMVQLSKGNRQPGFDFVFKVAYKNTEICVIQKSLKSKIISFCLFKIIGSYSSHCKCYTLSLLDNKQTPVIKMTHLHQK